jgi:hypothetical protein
MSFFINVWTGVMMHVEKIYYDLNRSSAIPVPI